ncbi:MAG: hypothetical protein JNM39_05180 [Bdellovibrionaceae bacterium]|nr:hypothetical protein [Pseudobdellovibrionaceae bacterium]
MILGLFVGESFAELSVVESTPNSRGTLREHQRWYLPKHGLKAYLQNWLTKTPHKPERVIVSSRFLYKLAGHRLGGSVAQIVTHGFENWSHFTSLPTTTQSTSFRQFNRCPSLSSQDLVFPVHERILSDGSIGNPLDLSEIGAIHEKLQALGLKKVCLHFHNSNLNSIHQQQTREFLVALGYEIFEPPVVDAFPNLEPFTRWKTNTLSAAVSGTFEESMKEIFEGLSGQIKEEQIYFFDGDLRLHHGEPLYRLSSLFALEACLYSQLSKIMNSKMKADKPPTFLHFGIEHFSYITGDKTLTESPWGMLALGTQSCRDFSIQPSSLLDLHNDGSLVTKGNLSYEPGPIHLGRGHKPLVADLLIQETKWPEIIDLDEKQARTSLDRWVLLMQTWQRSVKKTSISRESFERFLRDQMSALLSSEIQNCTEGPIVKYGYLAEQVDIVATPQSDLTSSTTGIRAITDTVSEAQNPKSFLLAIEALERGL